MKIIPQNGMPAGVQVPLLEQRRLEGPKSSNPGSHSYDATVPGRIKSGMNVTDAWDGEPG